MKIYTIELHYTIYQLCAHVWATREKKKEKGSERNYAFHFNLLERGNFNRLDKFSGDVNRS